MSLPATVGPLSGPGKVRNRRRNPLWRFRRALFLVAVVATVATGATWSFVSQVELTEDNFDDLIETTYICTAEVVDNCGPGNAANELAAQGEDRVIISYAQMPQVLIDAVVAAEDSSYFDHRGVNPGGLLRAAYQIAKQQVTSEGGSFQGGSSITQQYIKLATGEDQVTISRKATEIVRAIKLEQQLAAELGSKEAAKEQILERYLNRAYFGRGAYGVQAASRVYFDKDVGDVTLPEAAYLIGLLRSPNNTDAWDNRDTAEFRRNANLGLMAEEGYITEIEAAEASADAWESLIPPPAEVVGLGDVAYSEIGSEYFVSAVRRQLTDIYPEGELYTQSLRVYTTLDPTLQRLAYETIIDRLDPSNPFMPQGSLIAVDDNGEVVAMMGGADWETSQVNLATGRAGGGSGFQAGSQMKIFALAEFIEQNFSPESYYEAPFTIEYRQDAEGKCARWKVSGGVTNNKARPNHRTVYQATASSLNTVFAQIATDIGAPQLVDMAQRLGIESEMLDCPSVVLGTNSVSPMEMAGAYANLLREGERLDPVFIERIEDAEGNILCWYPTDSCVEGGGPVRTGEQVVDASVARQVNKAMVGVVSGGTGRAGRLIDEEAEVTRQAGGKTGTTQNNRDAWFTGFTCGLTTSVWMGYPGEAGEIPRYMNDNANRNNDEEFEVPEEEWWPTMEEIFGTDEYTNNFGNGDITGGEIPTELWHDFMMRAVPLVDGGEWGACEIPTEDPDDSQRIFGQELLTTLVHCAEPDPALVEAAEAEAAAATSTTNGEGDGDGDDGEDNGSTTTSETTTTTEATTTTTTTTQPDGDGGDGDGDDGDGDENAIGLFTPSASVVGFGGVGAGAAGIRVVPAQDDGGEQQQPAPTTTTTAPPLTLPPTTEPCIPIDLDGNAIESTTTPLPGGGGDGGNSGGGGNDG